MALEIDNAVRRLSKRGVELGKPAGPLAFEALENLANLKLGSDFKLLYSNIDGFDAADFKSQFILWSIGDIISYVKENGFGIDQFGTKWLSVGDFMIDSDNIVAAVELDQARTKLLHEDSVLSDGLVDFFDKISTGFFDFF